MRYLLVKKELNLEVKKLIYNQVIRPAITYGAGVLGMSTERDLAGIGILERKILRAATGMYRREDGHYFENDVLYKKLELKRRIGEVIGDMEERAYEKRQSHRNDWYRMRMEELERRRMSMKLRNMEFERTRRERV